MMPEILPISMLVRRCHKIPTDGLLLYMPLSETISTAIVNGEEVTSGTVTGSSSVTFTTFKGVPCSKWTGSSFVTLTSLPVTESPYFISIWTNVAATNTKFAFRNESYPFIRQNNNGNGAYIESGIYKYDPYVANQWNFTAVAHDPTSGTYYIRTNDEIATGELETATTLKASAAYLGAYSSSSTTTNKEYRFTGYLAGFRIYNRMLDKYEIEALRHEFTPTEEETT